MEGHLRRNCIGIKFQMKELSIKLESLDKLLTSVRSLYFTMSNFKWIEIALRWSRTVWQFMVLTSYFDLLTSQAIDIFVWPLNRSKNNMSTAREVKRWLVGCHEDIFFFFWRFQRNGWFWCNLCPSWRNLNMPKGYSPSFGNFWASMYLKQYWRRRPILYINTKHCII